MIQSMEVMAMLLGGLSNLIHQTPEEIGKISILFYH